MSLPKVLIVYLEQRPLYNCRNLETENISGFDFLFPDFLRALSKRAEVLRASEAADVIEYLRRPTEDISAVLVVGPIVINAGFINVSSKLVQYAREGGTLIFGGLCSSLGAKQDFNDFFQRTLTVPWKVGSYRHTLFQLNPFVTAAHERFSKPSMPRSFRMEALHISGGCPESQVYVRPDNVVIMSTVFHIPVTNRDESPILFAEYGRGNVGWIGGVWPEPEYTAVLLAMCNL